MGLHKHKAKSRGRASPHAGKAAAQPRVPHNLGQFHCTSREGVGKRTYMTRDIARSVAKRLKLKGSTGVRAYHCPNCGLYHVGHYS
jgi:hypothetical protein